MNGHPAADDPGPWSRADRLRYYGECRQFLGVLGQKFESLLHHTSLFAIGFAGALISLRERVKGGSVGVVTLGILAAGGVAFQVLLMYFYFRQIRAVGRIMANIEFRLGLGDEDIHLLGTLRRHENSFFAKDWIRTAVIVYGALLALMVLTVSVLVAVL